MTNTKGQTAASETKAKSIKVKNLTLKLPPSLPFVTIRYVTNDDIDMVGFLNSILGDEQLEKVWEAGLSMDEGTELVEAILKKYGLGTGE
jgi:hypothetical protein